MELFLFKGNYVVIVLTSNQDVYEPKWVWHPSSRVGSLPLFYQPFVPAQKVIVSITFFFLAKPATTPSYPHPWCIKKNTTFHALHIFFLLPFFLHLAEFLTAKSLRAFAEKKKSPLVISVNSLTAFSRCVSIITFYFNNPTRKLLLSANWLVWRTGLCELCRIWPSPIKAMRLRRCVFYPKFPPPVSHLQKTCPVQFPSDVKGNGFWLNATAQKFELEQI